MRALVLPSVSAEGSALPSDPRLDFTITGTQWAAFIGLVANGAEPTAAATQAKINPVLLEGALRTVPERFAELKEAKLAAARKDWDYESVYALCDELALNGDIRAACAKRGKNVQQFLHLALRDPVVKDLYETAQKLRAELWNAEVISIVDNAGDDLTLDGKPNMAAVKRSDLRAQTRMKLMEHYNDSKYGAAKNKQDVTVTVNVNAVERLEAAQKRVRNRTTQTSPVLIEQEPAAPPCKPESDAQVDTCKPDEASKVDSAGWME